MALPASNPFRQPVRQWQVRVFAGRDHVAFIEAAMQGLALSVSSFEASEDSEEWTVEVLTDIPSDEANIRARLALAAGIAGIETPRFEVREQAAKDWVSEVQKNFPPFAVGRFWVHGSHVDEMPRGKIPLRIDAGAAFGSGEHATTMSCLLALSVLAKRRRFRRPLDMGCGSGILAIAMAKLWHVNVTGIDIDPVSIEVARANAACNRVRRYAHFAAGNGYQAAMLRAHAPFDLIVANILARPLVAMAPDLAKHLAPGGIAVLSGLLASQERMVLSAHQAQGLRLVSRICSEQWTTLILARGRA